MEEFKNIVENFKEEFQRAKDSGLINEEMITDYEKAKRECIHSIIQYLLIKSGERAGFIPIPEVKTRQAPTSYGFKKQNQAQYKTDVAFYKLHEGRKELIGISEIFTLDMLAHLLPTDELKEKVEGKTIKLKRKEKTIEVNWPTSATKILHLIKYPEESPINNILLVAILPENITKGPPWDDWRILMEGTNNAFEVFSPYVKKLESKIREIGSNPYHILIKENEIFTD